MVETSEDEEILCAVAINISTPIHTLEKLANLRIKDGESLNGYSGTSRIHCYVAVNLKTPSWLLEQLANHKSSKVREVVAGHKNTLPEVLDKLARDKESEVWFKVATNPKTPTSALEYLAAATTRSFLAVTANPIFDLLALENPNSRFIKLSLARSSTTSEEILARFAKSQDEEILCAVAKNVATPIDILQKLANWFPVDERAQKVYPGSSIHACVAINPKTPPSLLKKLAAHGDSLVRQAVASNTNTSFKVLNKLARDREPKVRRAVAENPTTPASALEQLAGEDYKHIRSAL